MRTNNSFPCLLHFLKGSKHITKWGKGRSVSRDWARGGFGGLPTPLCWCWVQGANLVPCFCSGQKNKYPFLLWALQKWQVGFLKSFFVSFVRNLPNCACIQFCFLFCFCIFILEDRFVFSYRGDKFIHVQTLQHCSKGSKVPQPVSECIIYLFALLSLCQVYVMIFTSIISFNLCFQETMRRRETWRSVN